ncbi:hypothetical protein JQK88_33280 [Mesorhizobium caraganae]|nr:hypothetical protein [Mesorhizobium caraganae]
MAVFASRGRTGFVGKDSYVASQEFNRRAEEGIGRDGAAPCNRKWRDPLPSDRTRTARGSSQVACSGR